MIIGLTGPAGSGKSTVAEHLVASHGFKLIKFAGPLKAMLRALCDEMGTTPQQREALIEGDDKDNRSRWLDGHTPRHAMQTLGTEWGRECMGDNFWVGVAQQRIYSERADDANARIVFDDVRFENEANMIRYVGGTVIHMMGRGGIEGSHVSEGGVVDTLGDGFLYNQNCVPSLQLSVNHMINEMENLK